MCNMHLLRKTIQSRGQKTIRVTSTIYHKLKDFILYKTSKSNMNKNPLVNILIIGPKIQMTNDITQYYKGV